jgi:hypothetical protein
VKIPSRRKVYGIVTLISSILGLPGLVIQVWAFLDEQEEQERERQRLERERAEAAQRAEAERQRLERERLEIAKKAEADTLNGQITLARGFMEKCRFTEEHRTNISLALDRAEKELKLNKNFSGSSILYDSVKGDVIECRTGLSVQAPEAEPPASEPLLQLLQSILNPLQFIGYPLFALIFAGVFGFLWYRTSKRQSQERVSE